MIQCRNISYVKESTTVKESLPFCALDLCESDDMPGGNSEADSGTITKWK